MALIPTLFILIYRESRINLSPAYPGHPLNNEYPTPFFPRRID